MAVRWLPIADRRSPVVTQARIDYDASPQIRDVLSGIGRTEDVKFSPDNSRLAIVDYVNNKLILFSIRIQAPADDGAPVRIAIADD